MSFQSTLDLKFISFHARFAATETLYISFHFGKSMKPFQIYRYKLFLISVFFFHAELLTFLEVIFFLPVSHVCSISA
jgi:hypothetical protein